MIIAVDFDGTLCVNDQPNIPLFQKLLQAKRQGATLILWSCRAGSSLAKAVSFCRSYGLQFDCVNCNPPETVSRLGYDPRKILADIYLDDKSVPVWRPT